MQQNATNSHWILAKRKYFTATIPQSEGAFQTPSDSSLYTREPWGAPAPVHKVLSVTLYYILFRKIIHRLRIHYPGRWQRTHCADDILEYFSLNPTGGCDIIGLSHPPVFYWRSCICVGSGILLLYSFYLHFWSACLPAAAQHPRRKRSPRPSRPATTSGARQTV